MYKLSWKFILRTCLFSYLYCPSGCFVCVNFTILLNFGFALFVETYFFFMLLLSFLFLVCSFFSHNLHCLLQCCVLVIRMCTICITRFLICVYSLASQRLAIKCLVSQSRLDSRISDRDNNIPNYCISRNGSTVIGQIGIAVYIRNSIADITHRRQDLESDLVECIWLELKPSTNALLIFIYFSYEWFDNFVQMIDNIHTVKPHADILVLGDFNIDLLKPHSSRDSAITLLGLTQLAKSPTRITQTSSTLIGHIYTNNPHVITEVSVPDLSISDHCPISCSRSIKLPKCEPKTHSYISFRSFKLFNKARLPFSVTCTGPRSLKS